MSFELIFGFWVNIWLLGEFLAVGSFFVDFLPLVRFLDFGTILGFWKIFVIWFDFWLLGQYLASGSILGYWVDFCRFLPFGSIFGLWDDFFAFWRIFAFLDDFSHLV